MAQNLWQASYNYVPQCCNQFALLDLNRTAEQSSCLADEHAPELVLSNNFSCRIFNQLCTSELPHTSSQ